MRMAKKPQALTSPLVKTPQAIEGGKSQRRNWMKREREGWKAKREEAHDDRKQELTIRDKENYQG